MENLINMDKSVSLVKKELNNLKQQIKKGNINVEILENDMFVSNNKDINELLNNINFLPKEERVFIKYYFIYGIKFEELQYDIYSKYYLGDYHLRMMYKKSLYHLVFLDDNKVIYN